MTNQFYDKEAFGAGAASFNSVEKSTWQGVSRDTALVPATEQGVVSGSKGLLFLIAGTGLSIAGSGLHPDAFFIGFGLSVFAGSLVAVYDFQKNIGARYADVRVQELSRETYEREQRQAAQASRETLTVELVQEKNGFTQILRQELNTNLETMRAIAQVSELTVRGLQDAIGLTQNESQRIIGELVGRGFLDRKSNNQPAFWTSSGRALCRQLTVEE